MQRILLCLPLCLCLASDRPEVRPASPPAAPQGEVVRDNGGALPSNAEMERLARENPVAFLENCLRRYNREVKGYSCILQKQEKVDGRIFPTESIQVCFREKPFGVYFDWQQGARLAERVLYVEGENDGKILVRPRGPAARLIVGDVVSRDVDGADARQSGRVTLNQFGMKKGTERTLVPWKAAQEAGTLQVEYLGVKKVKEVGDRSCWALRRTLKKAEDDSITDVLIYVDTENWLQTGSVLKDDKGLLVGSYFFRDVRINPEFKKDQFQRSALIP